MGEQRVIKVIKDVDNIIRFSIWNLSSGNKKPIRTLENLLSPEKQIEMIREKSLQLIPRK